MKYKYAKDGTVEVDGEKIGKAIRRETANHAHGLRPRVMRWFAYHPDNTPDIHNRAQSFFAAGFATRELAAVSLHKTHVMKRAETLSGG